MCLRPNCCRAHHRASPCGSPSSALDSSVELLSALSPEERELLRVITGQGYPLRTAIIALQRAGQQTPDQVSVEMMLPGKESTTKTETGDAIILYRTHYQLMMSVHTEPFKSPDYIFRTKSARHLVIFKVVLISKCPGFL